ncbi:MAG: protein kinase, partial [Myxococcota bacterium]
MVKDSALKVKAGGLERYLGKVIGNRYAVVGYLGRGGMGVVYRARDLRGSGEVALKVLLSTSPSARARRRFLREAKVAARLRHPNVVVTYRFGRADGGFFLAMELIEGQPLSRFARQGLPFDVLIEVCVQVLSALSAAHEAGVIHRDLKPANILLSHTQHGLQVKVLDFGLARFAVYEDELTRTGELVGTPRYMSPEQARGSRDIGAETDLYALGVILYEFVTGKLLFEAETPTALAVMHITEPVPALEPRKGIAVPAGFEAVLRKLLSKDPKSRYNSAAAVRAALTPFLRGKRVKQQAASALPDLSIDDRYAEEAVSRSSIPVMAEQSSVRWPQPGEIRYAASFVGRDDVFNQLWGQCQKMVETGRGAVVFVSGETGVGKTRLMEELRARCFEGLSLDWFVGKSREGAGQGLWSLRQVMAALIGLRSEGHVDARRIIQSQLARWGTPTEDEVNRLTDLLRPRELDAVVMADGGEEENGREEVDRELMFGLVERVLRRAAAVRPTVLLMEDLHWAGVPTQQFLEYIIPSLHTTPAPLVLMTTLSVDREGASFWSDFPTRMRRYGPDTFQTVTLGRLDAQASRLMIEDMLKAADRLVDKIVELSEGNPLHILQVVRYLKEQGLILEKSGIWDVSSANGALVAAIPPELADLLQARVKALAERHELGNILTRVLDRCA